MKLRLLTDVVDPITSEVTEMVTLVGCCTIGTAPGPVVVDPPAVEPVHPHQHYGYQQQSHY